MTNLRAFLKCACCRMHATKRRSAKFTAALRAVWLAAVAAAEQSSPRSALPQQTGAPSRQRKVVQQNGCLVMFLN